MKFSYFYGNESDRLTFYRIPKLLITDPYFREVSTDAKVLYGLMLEGIVDLMLEVALTKKPVLHIAGDDYPTDFVRDRFHRINFGHIEYVMACMQKNTSKVRNIKAYMLTALFNAPGTMNSYYRAEVNHDLPQYAG